jgi:hypothetical protein
MELAPEGSAVNRSPLGSLIARHGLTESASRNEPNIRRSRANGGGVIAFST